MYNLSYTILKRIPSFSIFLNMSRLRPLRPLRENSQVNPLLPYSLIPLFLLLRPVLNIRNPHKDENQPDKARDYGQAAPEESQDVLPPVKTGGQNGQNRYSDNRKTQNQGFHGCSFNLAAPSTSLTILAGNHHRKCRDKK